MSLIAETNVRRQGLATDLRGWPLFLGALVGTAAGLIGVGWHAAAVVGPILGVLGAAVAQVDLRHRRIPDRYLVGGSLVAIGVAAFVEIVGDLRPAMAMVAGACWAAVPLLVVHLVAPAGIGFGDVKFAAVVGALLGVVEANLAALAVVGACVLAIVGCVARLWPRRSIPFAVCLTLASIGSLVIGPAWTA